LVSATGGKTIERDLMRFSDRAAIGRLASLGEPREKGLVRAVRNTCPERPSVVEHRLAIENTGRYNCKAPDGKVNR